MSVTFKYLVDIKANKTRYSINLHYNIIQYVLILQRSLCEHLVLMLFGNTSVNRRGLYLVRRDVLKRGWTRSVPVKVHSSGPVVRRPIALMERRKCTSPRLGSHWAILWTYYRFNRKSISRSLTSWLRGFWDSRR